MSEEREVSLPVGVVLRRGPGVTRWAGEVWRAVAVLPGAAEARWKVLRQEGDVVEYHAATLPLTLYRADAEAYRVALEMTPPTVFVVLRTGEDRPRVHAVTASPYEAQDYTDSGEEIVEPIPMPDALLAWVKAFHDRHYEETPFIKRKRDRKRIDLSEDGIGDSRIRQTADVYRAPGVLKPKAGE